MMSHISCKSLLFFSSCLPASHSEEVCVGLHSCIRAFKDAYCVVLLFYTSYTYCVVLLFYTSYTCTHAQAAVPA
jgi:hypothetical protein